MTVIERLTQFRTPTVLLALLLLVAVGTASIWGIVRLSRATGWVEHSYRVLAKGEELQASLRTAESAARAYRLTGGPDQLAAYLAEAPRSRGLARELVALVRDSPERSALAGALQRATSGRLAELERVIEVQHTQGIDAARSPAQFARGHVLMREVDQAHEALGAAERRVLGEGKAGMEQRARLLVTFVAVGTVLPIGLLVVLMAGLARENRRAHRLEREARAAMTALETAAIHRDRLSEQRRQLGRFAGLLQSCQSIDEAMSLTAGVARDLLPHAGGRCYVMRESRNSAESASVFGAPSCTSSEQLQPDQCWALRRGQAHLTGPGQGGMRCAHLGPASGEDDWTMCVPMIAQGTTLGLLHVSGGRCPGTGTGDSETVGMVAEQLSQTIANLRLRESLRVQSLRDPMTGLYNRRYLEENLYRELQRCERRGLPLSVLMLDVDHFKRFNDEHGHAAGDAVLTSLAEVLGKLTRGEDIACRYGGEEFTIVLPEAPLEIALRRAEQIRAAVATTSIIHMRRPIGPVTVSIGVASFPGQANTPERLLSSADSALYRAKAAGRDRVASANGEAPSPSAPGAIVPLTSSPRPKPIMTG